MNTEGRKREAAFLEPLEGWRETPIKLLILPGVLGGVLCPILQSKTWRVNNLYKVLGLVNKEAHY